MLLLVFAKKSNKTAALRGGLVQQYRILGTVEP